MAAQKIKKGDTVVVLSGKDKGRTGEVVKAMANEKVFIGRVWPAWPTHVRVSVGTKDEMAKFKVAFKKVMSA